MTDTHKVLTGKDGWLFLDNDANGAIEQIQGRRLLSDEELSRWVAINHTRQDYFRDLGIPFLTFSPPNKECLYEEFLPTGIQVAPHRIIHQLITAGVPIDYMIAPLRNAKAIGPVYYKKDTHWTQFGSFIAYQHMMRSVCEHVRTDVLGFADVEFVQGAAKETDLGKKIGEPEEDAPFGRIVNASAKLTHHNGIPQNGNYRVFENPSKPHLPVAAIFCDSFSVDLRHYLVESFSKCFVVRLPGIDRGLIEKFRPDIVIFEQVERFLVRPPHDGNGNLKALMAKKRAAHAAPANERTDTAIAG